ncbi:MAG: hypothetical protein IPJ11_15315 [Gemmatimonadetes bacterium]|nr:hypothetical protein [Gemmatimonadota bacterium]
MDSLQVGGIIISTGTPLDMAAKLNALQRRAPLPSSSRRTSRGGTTMRVALGTGFPTQMGDAATGKVEDSYTMGRITGVEARAMGVHRRCPRRGREQQPRQSDHQHPVVS